MILKVGILGASGRMGLEITALLQPGFILGEDRLEFCDGISAGKSLKAIDGVTLRDFDESPREPVHVWIDFSGPEATLRLLEQINTPLVIGTTGFTDQQLKKVEDFSKKQPVLLTANTSPGMNAMMDVLEQGSLSSLRSYDVLASDIHHRGKKDSPSGTMKTLLSVLKDQGFKEAQVNSARVGDEKGTHSISFFSDEEELTLIHRVNHRRVFAKGALLAAQFIAKQKKPGLYRFGDIK